MNILLISHNKTGVDYYRLDVPHKTMPGIRYASVPMMSGLPNPEKHLEQFDIAVFNRTLSVRGDIPQVAKTLRDNGVKIVLDIDDYWILPTTHLNYKTTKFKENFKPKTPEQLKVYNEEIVIYPTPKEVMDSMKFADIVTCTTPLLASKIKPFNSNVHVLPNGISTLDNQWTTEKKESDKVRVGWVAGVHHIKDVSVCFNEFEKLKEIPEDHMLYYGGWVDAPENNLIARYLSGGGDNPRYNNIKAMDIWNYAQMYDHVDISIAPLQNNVFNRCKSELKAIEAGFKKCAFIGQDMYPYKYVCNESNSILVKKKWCDAIQKLIKEPNLRNDLADRLHEDVVRDRSLEKINVKRKQIYENIT